MNTKFTCKVVSVHAQEFEDLVSFYASVDEKCHKVDINEK
jgi:hypothetical protein